MFALNISMKVSRSEALTVMDAITFIILVAVSAIEQTHILLATAEAAYVNVVLVEQFQIEVAKGSLFLKDSVGLMSVSAPGHDYWQVVTGMIGGIAKVTAQYHGGMIKQSSFPFLDLIHFKKEPVIVLEGIDLDFAQSGDYIRPVGMV